MPGRPGSMMPFHDLGLEREFVTEFQRRRVLIDFIVAILISCQAGWYVWEGYAACVLPFMCFELLVVVATFLPGYDKWRGLVMVASRCSLGVTLWFFNHEMVARAKPPDFLGAAMDTGFRLARLKLPMYFIFYPMPLLGITMTIQAIVVGCLMHISVLECDLMVVTNKYYAVFAEQLSRAHGLWRDGGSAPSCAYLCTDVMYADMASGRAAPSFVATRPELCQRLCGWLLPAIWTVYGEPWSVACFMHRLIWVPILGYALPIAAMYLWELRDRWTFAKARGLHVPTLSRCMWQELGHVVREAAGNAVAILYLLLPQ